MKIYNNKQKATEHFKHNELFTKSEDFAGKSHDLDDRTLRGLEFIRVYYDQPLRITSTYRTEAGNIAAKGASKSFHMLGKAIDFQAVENPAGFVQKFHSDYTARGSEIKAHLDHFGVRGVFFYPTFIHIDCRDDANSVDYRKPAGIGVLLLLVALFLLFS